MIENQENKIQDTLKDINEKLNVLLTKQMENESKIKELIEKVNAIYEDIYDVNEDEFEITCPYCNFDFYADVNESFNEIKCPKCGNSIELDWNGNPDEQDFDCNGSCSHCKGCED